MSQQEWLCCPATLVQEFGIQIAATHRLGWRTCDLSQTWPPLVYVTNIHVAVVLFTKNNSNEFINCPIACWKSPLCLPCKASIICPTSQIKQEPWYWEGVLAYIYIYIYACANKRTRMHAHAHAQTHTQTRRHTRAHTQ